MRCINLYCILLTKDHRGFHAGISWEEAEKTLKKTQLRGSAAHLERTFFLKKMKHLLVPAAEKPAFCTVRKVGWISLYVTDDAFAMLYVILV